MDNEPKIQTAVKDYNGKKVNLIKLDIILTIVLFVVIGLMIYSLYPKFKNTHFMGNIDEEYKEVTTTEVVSNDKKIDVVELESENFIVYKVTNQTGSVKDITLRLNTYVGDSVDNTLSYERFGIDDNASFYAFFKKSDLKIYDKYEYVVNSSNSLYSSAKEYIKLYVGDYDKFNYRFTNSSGAVINSVSFIIIYYDTKNNIVDIEEKTKTLFEDNDIYEFNVKDNYDRFEVYVNEAYYTKKES
ncbi:MAG: hypothetical protein J6X02_02155 [Bacilli bacterium]|nr:hypothetical protein [Bacilli bacterium]